MILFVYGTLMAGQENHRQLAGARFVGKARTLARYTLARAGGFPALREGGTTAVPGELYDLDESVLPALDAFEGEGYVRKDVDLEGGARVQAYLRS